MRLLRAASYQEAHQRSLGNLVGPDNAALRRQKSSMLMQGPGACITPSTKNLKHTGGTPQPPTPSLPRRNPTSHAAAQLPPSPSAAPIPQPPPSTQSSYRRTMWPRWPGLAETLEPLLAPASLLRRANSAAPNRAPVAPQLHLQAKLACRAVRVDGSGIGAAWDGSFGGACGGVGLLLNIRCVTATPAPSNRSTINETRERRGAQPSGPKN